MSVLCEFSCKKLKGIWSLMLVKNARNQSVGLDPLVDCKGTTGGPQ